jgi:hypothetical protein
MIFGATSHNFEMGMNRLWYMAPAMVAALGSNPENTIKVCCQNNSIPANLRRAEKRNRHREIDLINK